MTESNMRQLVVKALKPLDAFSVENPARPGTPDVNYVEGWIELKLLHRWPVKPNTPVKIDIFTPQQRTWLIRRCKRGGRAFFLLKVRSEWILLWGDDAARNIGTWTRSQLIKKAVYYGSGNLVSQELIRALKTHVTTST